MIKMIFIQICIVSVISRWENPLMGWTSTGDPYAHVGDSALCFDSEEAAIEFAQRHGWDYTVCGQPSLFMMVYTFS